MGAAVRYAMAGGRVCAEIMYMDFLGRAGDEVFNQLSKWQSMSSKAIRMPVVLRMSIGSNTAPSIHRIGRRFALIFPDSR